MTKEQGRELSIEAIQDDMQRQLANLMAKRDELNELIAEAKNQITGFEACLTVQKHIEEGPKPPASEKARAEAMAKSIKEGSQG